MGCVISKQAVSVKPAVDHSVAFRDNAVAGSGRSRCSGMGELEKKKRTDSRLSGSELGESGRVSSNGCGGGGESVSFRLGNLQKYVEGEQVAAGWPAWLSAVSGEAIHGWVRLSADSFEKLEKIGQGTYSSVFRARNLENGRIVALKKVRFDNFEPESVRFMAREIMILRRLDHPNIIKLEGLITSRLSCSIYLVFEYMEHDISGLFSCPDVKFSEAQVKCYMRQLLSGVEQCHSRGMMHRDIKEPLWISGVLAVYLLNFSLGDPSFRAELRLNNYTKFSSFVGHRLMIIGKNLSFLMQLYSSPSILMKALFGRP